jgi:seipin
MLSLSLLSPSYKSPLPSISPKYTPQLSAISEVAQEDILFYTRRPAILTYSSRLVSSTETLFSLPLYVLGIKRESEILRVPMAERATFPKGWKNVPAFAMLELQSEQEVQVYDVRLQFKARFGGLRWLMYNHRIISFVVFTSAFWISECIFTILGWLILRAVFSSNEDKVKKEAKGEETDTTAIKNEEDEEEPDLSDTLRTFPTYGRQPPLKYTPKIKDEDSEEYIIDETAIQPLAAEADDEDDEEFQHRSGRTDSGIGTSFSEGGERSAVKRRTSRGGGR